MIFTIELLFFEMMRDPVRMARYAELTIPGVFYWGPFGGYLCTARTVQGYR